MPSRYLCFVTQRGTPHLTGHILSTSPTMALYSDVVVLRPPSLREETTALISTHQHSSEDAKSMSQIEPDHSSLNEILVTVSRDINHKEIQKLTSNEERVPLLKESEGNQQTNEKHRHCVCSLGSKERT